MSVLVFQFHLGADTVLNLLEEIQDALLVAQVTNAALDKFDACFFVERRDDDVPKKILIVELASALAHVGQDIVYLE